MNTIRSVFSLFSKVSKSLCEYTGLEAQVCGKSRLVPEQQNRNNDRVEFLEFRVFPGPQDFLINTQN